MTGDGSFLVEEFIDAITSQLDRVQDALRMKAVNRPLTYALKDLSLELKVFVEMDAQGRVRFRTSGANESGTSVVHLGFTTITKPMIEENTISLAATRSPTLEEAGFAPDERQRLERVGVRNVVQLQRLGSSTGVRAVARLAEMPVDRLRQALTQGAPKLRSVQPEAPPPRRVPPASPHPAAPPLPPRPAKSAAPRVADSVVPPAPNASRVVAVTPDTRRLRLSGSNLLGEFGPPAVHLNDQPLAVHEADEDGLVVELPSTLESGALEVRMPDGNVLTYDLSVDAGDAHPPLPPHAAADDHWAPSGRAG